MAQMKKVLAGLLMSTVILCGYSLSHANLIQNAGFEDWNNNWSTPNFSNWTESGSYGATSDAHTGNLALMLYSGGGGAVSSNVNIVQNGTYSFGAWFKLYSDSDPRAGATWDKVGITANIYLQAGGAQYFFPSVEFPAAPSWKPNPDGYGYVTDWFLIQSTFNATQPILNAELNIYLQDNSPGFPYTSARVDDAFLKPVPIPAAAWMLGTGLLGLVAIRRRFK
jgi:hypothetical protein